MNFAVSRWRLLAALLSVAPAGARAAPSVAFFYGEPVPVAELSRFDWVVVQPEHLAADELERLRRGEVQVFAYLSLGEAAAGAVEPGWILGRNAGWGTAIVDPGAEGWRRQVLEQVEALHRRGFQGLFLDTLDSYALALGPGEAREAARVKLAGLVRAIHERRPGLKLFFNRGFEILGEVGGLAAGLAAESLLFGWDPTSRSYVEVSAADREWLADQLRRVAERFRIPVVALDYLPASRRDEARAAAKQLQQMGFVPWISTPAMDAMGVGLVEMEVAQAAASLGRVLLVHDGAESLGGQPGPVVVAVAERLRAMGWEVESLDVRQGPLPAPMAGRCAGVVTWFTDDDLPASLQYPRWLDQQLELGVRVAILGRPGFPVPPRLLSRLGLEAATEGSGRVARVARVVKRDGLVGLEAEPLPRSRGLLRLRGVSPGVSVHLRVEDERGRPVDPVVTAPWGGLALQPYLLETGYQGRLLWIVDPAAFLAAALRPVRGGEGR